MKIRNVIKALSRKGVEIEKIEESENQIELSEGFFVQVNYDSLTLLDPAKLMKFDENGKLVQMTLWQGRKLGDLMTELKRRCVPFAQSDKIMKVLNSQKPFYLKLASIREIAQK